MMQDPDNSVDIIFGAQSLTSIASLIRGRRYALLTYDDPIFAYLTRRVADLAGMPTFLFNAVEPNPSLQSLRRLGKLYEDVQQDVGLCVALGGGSVIDTAKAFAIGHGNYAPLQAALDGQPPEREALPIIAIPTTAGTGSEVTCWATLWDMENGRKLSLEGADLYPEAAIVDPALMLALPVGQTLSCALDALSHALESLWNHNANTTSRALAIESAQLILQALPRVMDAPDDLDHRTQLAEGALLAGLAFSHTRTALAHSLSYSLTIHHDVPHGLACSFSLPAVMRATLGVSPVCDAALGEIFSTTPQQAPAALDKFLTSLGIPLSPAAFGVTPGEWAGILSEAGDGPRGRNFIGEPTRLPDLFAAEPSPPLVAGGRP